MPRVLLIQERIPEYRIHIFNLIAKECDLTVIYSDGKKPKDCEFACIYVPLVRLHFKVHKANLYRLASKFDVVICTEDFSMLYSRLFSLLPRRFKLIYWGIGVSAGYNERYDSNQQIAKICCEYAKRADAMLFYSDYPVKKYSAMGITPKKLFVANNTVYVKMSESASEKKIVLFIGSLYKQKKIDKLLEAYKNAVIKNPHVLKLVIIGDGDERDTIIKYIRDNNLISKIQLTGHISDEEVLENYFKQSLLCISPDQAGLSVLKSMGYGVPFVTYKDAITGGERFNIHHGIDGILLDDYAQIEDVILDASSNKEKYVEMGNAAKAFYFNNRLPEMMAQGFFDAINYVTKK